MGLCWGSVAAAELGWCPPSGGHQVQPLDRRAIRLPAATLDVMSNESAIAVRGLRKSYGPSVALDGIDLDISRGEVFALVGPNGAGKTTTVEILEGYRYRDGGTVAVLAEDPASAGRDWRARIQVRL